MKVKSYNNKRVVGLFGVDFHKGYSERRNLKFSQNKYKCLRMHSNLSYPPPHRKNFYSKILIPLHRPPPEGAKSLTMAVAMKPLYATIMRCTTSSPHLAPLTCILYLVACNLKL